MQVLSRHVIGGHLIHDFHFSHVLLFLVRAYANWVSKVLIFTMSREAQRQSLKYVQGTRCTSYMHPFLPSLHTQFTVIAETTKVSCEMALPFAHQLIQHANSWSKQKLCRLVSQSTLQQAQQSASNFPDTSLKKSYISSFQIYGNSDSERASGTDSRSILCVHTRHLLVNDLINVNIHKH